MNSKVTYHQQVSYCGKPRCRKCREGTGHGPYWYSYKTVDGRTTRTYIGKELPADVREAMNGPQEASPPPAHADELALSQVRIYTLGQFRLERRGSRDAQDWQTVTDSSWQHQRVRSLLAGLVSNAARRVGREQLLELLWPELELEVASSRLDRAVYSLRQIFEPQRAKPASSPLLLTERELLVLGEHPQVWIDADVFEKLINEAREIGEKDLGKKESLLIEAMSLYGGAFLPEMRKSDWTQSRRESLLRAFIGLLLDLSDVRSKRDSWVGALEPLNKLLSLDPTNEAAVQRMMLLLFRLERRGEALQAYKQLVGVLRREFNIAPLPETRAIYEKVRSGNLPDKPAMSNQQEAQKEQRHIPPLPASLFGRSHVSPLVGRREEINLLSGMLKEIESSAKFRLPGQKKSIASPLDTQRRPQCVLLMGEVGIGKTRLAEEVSREAKRGNWAVAWSRVYAQEGSIPYRLWTEVLRRSLEQGLWQRQEMQRRASILQPLTALLPDLQEFFPSTSSNPMTQSPEREQLRMWEAALELLTMISENTPLVIALDDLQWADQNSCELLAYLARRINGYPIFIVGTCRENELTPNHALRPLLTDLLREHAVESVPLQPLDNKEIEALVSYIPHLPEMMVQRIGERAGGNPFFAEELGRALGAAEAQQASTNGSNGANPNTNIVNVNPALLPDTITAVLDLRLSRLSIECQGLLRKAAILGRSFEFPQIAAMESGSIDYDDDNADLVLDHLEEALASGMLTEEGTGTHITYQFWHPMLVSHLSERLSAARRANLHRRAAEILRREYQHREEEGAALIVDHLVSGGSDSTLIARYGELAGNRSYSLSDFPGAEKYYRIAIENIEVTADEELHLSFLYEYLAECNRVQGKFEEARGYYQHVLDIYTRHLKDSTSGTHEQESQILALLWSEIGTTWYDTGDNPQALKHFEEGERVLKEANIAEGAIWATLHWRQSYIFYREGNYNRALMSAHEALRLFEEALKRPIILSANVHCSARTARTLSGNPIDIGRTYSLLGLIENAVGQPLSAIQNLNAALTILEQQQAHREIATVHCNLGDMHLRKAELEEAQASLRNALTIAQKVGDQALSAVILNNLGIVAAWYGDLGEAESLYRRGLALAEQVNDPVYIDWLLVYLAMALQDQGNFSDTKKYLRRALGVGRSIHFDPCIGAALVAIGSMRIYQALAAYQSNIKKRILRKAQMTLLRALSLDGLEAQTQTEGKLALVYIELLQGQYETALQRARETLEDALKYEMVWLVARSQQLLGCIFAAQNQYEQAYTYFEEAKNTFSQRSMRLEYARTLYHFGNALLQQNLTEKDRVRGLLFLQEAQKICAECKAALDLQLVEHVLAQYKVSSTKIK
jgi:predicted ATPase/DNA-binding SARP family transcriptional activator